MEPATSDVSDGENKSATGKIAVIIVEDHEVTLHGLKAGLSSEPDIEVLGLAADSQQGLELARQLKPHVVLLDLHLPHSPGPKTLVQQFLSVPDLDVIVFSGENRMGIIQIVLEMGVAGYLLKSESAARVADAIRRVRAGKQPVISIELVTGDQKLTKAEQHLLKMLARGMKYQDIADKRVTSPATVRKQCELLLLKLQLETREELIAWAVENGYGNLELEA